MSKVYTFGPTFRAENSNTSRHLAEFWMVEPEIAFANLEDNATLAQRLLQHVISVVLNEREDDIAFFGQHIDDGVIARLRGVVDSPFERLDYSEAIEILKKKVRRPSSFRWPGGWTWRRNTSATSRKSTWAGRWW
jgi:asparaginyl-tRNA synthetase